MFSPWPSLNSSPAQLVNRTVSPSLMSSGWYLPSLFTLPGPTASTLPFCGLFRAVSGSRMPPAVFSSASKRRITKRSPSGLIFIDTLRVSWQVVRRRRSHASLVPVGTNSLKRRWGQQLRPFRRRARRGAPCQVDADTPGGTVRLAGSVEGLTGLAVGHVGGQGEEPVHAQPAGEEVGRAVVEDRDAVLEQPAPQAGHPRRVAVAADPPRQD